VSGSPWVGAVGDITELASFYAEPPAAVRVNMIFSADGPAAFGGCAGPLSCPTDQQLLKILRGFADVVLVGAGTACAENYGPVRGTSAPATNAAGYWWPARTRWMWPVPSHCCARTACTASCARADRPCSMNWWTLSPRSA
jgi:hypothetical protein